MAGITIRRIVEDDLRRGFLESLDSLRTASDIGDGKAREILAGMAANPDHVIFVAEDGAAGGDGRIVGSITLLVEQKFIHGGGLVGHIEDVVVSGDMQGRRIGRMLVEHALDHARSRGCYKTILDCQDDVRGFYERIGFSRASNAMRFDHGGDGGRTGGHR